jgi:hypothetical protein
MVCILKRHLSENSNALESHSLDKFLEEKHMQVVRSLSCMTVRRVFVIWMMTMKGCRWNYGRSENVVVVVQQKEHATIHLVLLCRTPSAFG